jgi:hypothetical protein
MLRQTTTTRAAVAVALVACGCGAPVEQSAGRGPFIQLGSRGDPGGADAIEVVGLSADDLSRLRASALSLEQWQAVLRVTVDGGGAEGIDRPAVLGAYAVVDQALRFTPTFAFDPGRRYRAVFVPSALPGSRAAAAEPWRSGTVETVLQTPAPVLGPTTRVVNVYPTASEIAENQLRLYVQFSAPMGHQGGHEHVRLLDGSGHPVEGAFLPLDVGLWSVDRTRFTLLFDPGRVKRGILPNEELGRSIERGRRYTLVIDREWRDAQGSPLAESFSRSFTVGPPVEAAIDPADWRLRAPAPGTRDPLLVTFPRPLDYALLQRALQVRTEQGDAVDGTVAVEAAETAWSFTPRVPWREGEYYLKALAVLEDPAGNRIGRPFEDVPLEDAAAVGHAHAPTHVLFSVRPRRP